MNLRAMLVSTLLAAACTTSADLDTTAQPLDRGAVEFVGPGNNWFTAANWSTGRVPGPSDVVVIGDDAEVVLDADLAPNKLIDLRELHVRDAAQLEVIHGAIVRTELDTVDDDAQVTFRASADIGDTTLWTSCRTCRSNPKPKTKRFIILQSSVTADFGLGGTTPASIAFDATGAPQLAAGPGHYSTMTAETVALAGNLELSLYYGFTPRAGDVYRIIDVTGRRTGEFTNLPEGAAVACTDDLLCARISYRGGDGNDVTLSIAQYRTSPTAKRMHRPLVITKELDKS